MNFLHSHKRNNKKTAPIRGPPLIPNDIVQYILPYFADNLLSLYSCIQVNRYWCRSTIPLLYDDAIGLVKAGNTMKLMKTLSQCLEDEDRKNLSRIGIKHSKFKSHQPPLFNYPAFLSVISEQKLLDLLSFWTITDQVSKSNVRKAVWTLFKSFVLSAKRIKKLSLNGASGIECSKMLSFVAATRSDIRSLHIVVVDTPNNKQSPASREFVDFLRSQPGLTEFTLLNRSGWDFDIWKALGRCNQENDDKFGLLLASFQNWPVFEDDRVFARRRNLKDAQETDAESSEVSNVWYVQRS